MPDIEMNYIETLGFKVFSDDLNLIQIKGDRTRVLNTISPNSYGITTKNPIFDNALKTADYLVLDGVYFAIAPILLQGKNIRRNQGPDVFFHFINRLNEQGGRAFFLGSTEDVLEKIKIRAAAEYPNIEVRCFSPPFKPVFSDEEDRQLVETINGFKPHILFVGMTCPKQEIWAIKNRPDINNTLVICIGNVFDWFAGTQRIIHPFWFKIRLGWLVRIFYRPEIFKRNIGNQMKFFFDVLLYFFHLKKK